MAARLLRRRLIGRPPRRILLTQSTSLRWTWAPDEPLLIDSVVDVAPQPRGSATRGRRTQSQQLPPSSTFADLIVQSKPPSTDERGLGLTALCWLVQGQGP